MISEYAYITLTLIIHWHVLKVSYNKMVPICVDFKDTLVSLNKKNYTEIVTELIWKCYNNFLRQIHNQIALAPMGKSIMHER